MANLPESSELTAAIKSFLNSVESLSIFTNSSLNRRDGGEAEWGDAVR